MNLAHLDCQTLFLSVPSIHCDVSVTPSIVLYFHPKQEEDVALPEVPNEPVPEIPEAAKMQPGKIIIIFFPI